MSSPTDVVLVAPVRTAVAKFGGAFKDLKATDLGAIVLREALARAGLAPALVDDVLMGMVVQAGAGQNPARQAALKASLPDTVAATTVNKVCGSGLEAIVRAAQAIRAGDAQCVLAGGMESMTNAPYVLPKARGGYRYGNGVLVDALFHDGLMDAFSEVAMGETGEVVADEFRVTREQADAFAERSHRLAQKATESGWFKQEIVPVEVGGPQPADKSRPAGRDGVAQGKGRTLVATDEGIRPETTKDALGKLRPAFRPSGIVTAGNSSQLSDGASAMVVASRKFAQEHGLEIAGRFVASATAGVAPLRVMAAPIPGVQQLLLKTRQSVDDVDLFEHNEAFASASCAVRAALGVPDEKFNVTGGAVALGHPIGASGARLVTTLLHNLQRTGGRRGVATLCLGGGNSIQALIERE